VSTGVDYAWSHPSPAALHAAGVTFACRYLSTDKSKSLTLTEAKALAAAGISSVVVWETTANRMLGGKAAGVADAKDAAAQATACGMPASRPIYFAADWDATETQQTQINAYLDGAASVLGRSRVGIYGGYYPVKRAMDAGKATWAWQTIAWSGGQWDPRAHIRQGAQKSIGGVSCDLDTSMKADFGQWKPGQTPTPEDDMTATPTDGKVIAKAFLDYDGAPAPAAGSPYANADAKTNTTWTLRYWFSDVTLKVREAAASATAALNILKAGTPVTLTDAQLDTLAEKVAPVVADRLADLLAARLQS